MYVIAFFASGIIGSGNSTPIADAGSDQLSVGHPFNVNLNGGASSDPDGDALTFSWVETSSLGITLNNPNTATPDFDTLDAGDTYVLELTVSDPKGKTDTDTVTITT